MEILDMKCAQSGSEIASAAGYNETLITKALGVLKEDGVYAFFLYLFSLNNSQSQDIAEKSFEFLEQDEVDIIATKSDLSKTIHDLLDELGKIHPKAIRNDLLDRLNKLFLEAIRNDLLDELGKLLLAKELLERALVYARYHAKAASEGEQTKESQ